MLTIRLYKQCDQSMCVGVCLLGYLFVCLCGIRACMNEWMSDVRKWSMSIAHSSNSSSVWFAWPSIKQYPHRHLLSHTQRESWNALTRTHESIHKHTINTTLDLCYHSASFVHYFSLWVCLKFDFAALVTPPSPRYHDDDTSFSCLYFVCDVLLQIPAQMSHMIYSDREWKTHT